MDPRPPGRPASGRTATLPQCRVKPSARDRFVAIATARGMTVADAQREAYGEWTRRNAGHLTP